MFVSPPAQWLPGSEMVRKDNVSHRERIRKRMRLLGRSLNQHASARDITLMK